MVSLKVSCEFYVGSIKLLKLPLFHDTQLMFGIIFLENFSFVVVVICSVEVFVGWFVLGSPPQQKIMKHSGHNPY